jgi:hypothetical protein
LCSPNPDRRSRSATMRPFSPRRGSATPLARTPTQQSPRARWAGTG